MATKAHIEDLRTIRDNVLCHRSNSLHSKNTAINNGLDSYLLFQGEKDACDRILVVIDQILANRKITL